MGILTAIGAFAVAIIIAFGVIKALELMRSRAENSEGKKK